jgi:polyvinyl alcohol dehydrogenase (cytochrome)
MRWSIAFGCLTMCVVLATSSSASVRPIPLATYHGDNARTGFSAGTSISSANAASLLQKWHDTVGASISDQPIVANGVVYWGDWTGHMHATTLAGTSVWSTALGTASKPKSCPYDLATQGIVSSAAVGTVDGKNLVWVGGGAGQVVALNVSNGKVVWSTRLGTPPEYVTWSSPTLYDGSVYEGVASFNDCPVINGSFDRLNAATGAIEAINHLSIPSNCVGPGIWSSPAIDPSTNSIYVSTSNANLRKGNGTCEAAPDQEAILRLDSTTLVVTERWQVPTSQQVSDSDFGGSPMLFTATIDGVNRQLVGAVNKNGVYYVLDRDNLAAGPVWTYTAESAATLASSACSDVNTISSSAWAGPGAPIMVAGLAVKGATCIGTLAALNPSTGTTEWQVPLQGPVLGAVTEVPGLVAVGAGAHVDVLASSTGATLFSYAEPKSKQRSKKRVIFGAPVGWFWSPPTIAGQFLFAANQDGTLRAFSP